MRRSSPGPCRASGFVPVLTCIPSTKPTLSKRDSSATTKSIRISSGRLWRLDSQSSPVESATSHAQSNALVTASSLPRCTSLSFPHGQGRRTPSSSRSYARPQSGKRRSWRTEFWASCVTSVFFLCGTLCSLWWDLENPYHRGHRVSRRNATEECRSLTPRLAFEQRPEPVADHAIDGES